LRSALSARLETQHLEIHHTAPTSVAFAESDAAGSR
jgi:hypothetical protein